MGGPSQYLPAMHATGIPAASIPTEMGGTYKETRVYDSLKEFVARGDQDQQRTRENSETEDVQDDGDEVAIQDQQQQNEPLSQIKENE